MKSFKIKQGGGSTADRSGKPDWPHHILLDFGSKEEVVDLINAAVRSLCRVSGADFSFIYQVFGQIKNYDEATGKETKLKASSKYVYTGVDDQGYICEPGHPGEGMKLVDCQGYREEVDIGRVIYLTHADPPWANEYTCHWSLGRREPCGKEAVCWKYGLEWLALCLEHENNIK